MKKSFTLLLCLSLAAYIWFGHSSGPGLIQSADRTGGPLSNNGNTFCSMCHSGGNFGTDVFLTLLSESGDTITEYEPETAYTLKVNILAEGAAAYGFQAVALDGANAQAGAYGMVPSGTQVVTVGGVDYAEHSERDSDGSWDIPWTSPAIGAGSVTFYAAGNAVNNADATSGDDPDTTSLQVAEALGAGLADIDHSLKLELAPNPTADILQVSWTSELAKPNALQILSVTGQLMVERDLGNTANNLELSVQNYPTGVYFVRANTSQGIQTKRFSKL
ncbi:MAG: T9SS type A sorting domain-containing protein [Saprospiraceae bacterium]|nr:T9SS type A sorting domain-containing protein [Saprospiraceae bacterium]